MLFYLFHHFGIDAVAGPTTGGIIIAFEVARQLGLPSVYVETENGARTLRRGKTLAPGLKVLIVASSPLYLLTNDIILLSINYGLIFIYSHSLM